ncbi:MAG: prenyltransferase/squalene oxidase repeat-containing protein [Planctomycetota bacterium]
METAEIETRNPITSTLKQIGEASPETSSRLTDIVDAKLFRRTTPASMPNMSTPDINVDPTSGRRPSVASRTRLRRGGINPLGADVQIPDLGAGQSARANRGSAERDLASSESSRASDAMGSDSRSELSRRRSSESEFPETAVPEPASMALDLLAPLGRVGLSRRDAEQAGVVPDAQRPDIASMDISRNRRPKRDSGSPITPAGSQVSSVESFNRRTLRTQGGAAATPAGMVGPATEEAIERGLAYLADRQNEDGSWSLHGQGEPVMLRSDSAATGLCLLAFQGAGYTHKKHQYANVVAKGLNFLRTIQLTNGDLCKRQDALANNNVAFYSHGIAALAMSEAYGMTQDEELREPAQLALDYIAATQHRRRGGWRYTPQVSADTSVTGWMMMALKSGELSGLKVDPETYVGIERWLDFARESAARQDRYRYDPFAPDTDAQRHGRFVSPTMTSVGMLMRMYLGWKRDRQEMQSAADYLLNYPPEIGTPESPQRDTYYWYYATQVMFHMGGDYWKAWNKDLNPVLLEGQIKRGVEAGSWDPAFPVKDRWGPHAGRLYVTTMNLLNLEVYYRHLPIYEDTAD